MDESAASMPQTVGPPPIPRAILILGMHRSGTSALAGLLARMGVELGDNLYGADAEANARGFFEHRGAVALNASILDALGSRWDDIGSLPQGWWRRQELAPLKDDLRQLVQRDFAGVPTWGLKDPRLCRVLPLWLEVLGELGLRVHALIILRRPDEVVRSLERHHRIPPMMGHVLWLQHVAGSLSASRGLPRSILTYDALLADWRGCLESASRDLGEKFPKSLEESAEAVEAFLTPDLQHYRAAEQRQEELDDALGLARRMQQVYQEIQAADAPHRPATQTLAELGPAFALPGALMLEQRNRIDELGEGLDQALATIDSMREHVENSQANLRLAEGIIAKKDEAIATIDKQLTTTQAGLDEAMQQLARKDQQITEINGRLEEVGKGFEQAMEILAGHEKELATIRSHWVYRWLQRPLRHLARARRKGAEKA